MNSKESSRNLEINKIDEFDQNENDTPLFKNKSVRNSVNGDYKEKDEIKNNWNEGDNPNILHTNKEITQKFVQDLLCIKWFYAWFVNKSQSLTKYDGSVLNLKPKEFVFDEALTVSIHNYSNINGINIFRALVSQTKTMSSEIKYLKPLNSAQQWIIS